MADPIRIANCSGFYGDRLSAAREMVEGGPIDVLTGDWLAELTMLILAKNRMKDISTGYAKTFVKQMEEVMGQCAVKGIKVVTNAGGLNPKGCAAAVRAIADAQGLSNVKIAWIDGDDLLGRMPDLQAAGHEFRNIDTGEALGKRQMVTANAYLGGWGIVEALNRGADIVITGRTTDAAVVCGPAAWHHGWARDNYDALAGAIVAGHVIECGAQATGGNYCFFREVSGMDHPGFPIAEIAADGSSVITKHAGTGGQVSTGTVTAQLLYEIGEPAYKNPDVISRFDTIELEDLGNDRVLISGVRGEAPPQDLKVSMNYAGGWRTVYNMALTGLDIQAKADCYLDALWKKFPNGRDSFAETHVELIRGCESAANNEEHTSTLRIVVKDSDAKLASGDFFKKAVELGIANYPGLYGLPGSSQMYGVCWPTLVPAAEVTQRVHIDDELIELNCAPVETPHQPIESTPGPQGAAPAGTTTRAPLGRLLGARSGDKAGSANLGVWARSDAAWHWLRSFLTVERLAELMPEARDHTVKRYELASIRSLNFVFERLLGEGVAASARLDAQAKSLGEYLRVIEVDIPSALLE